VNFLAFILKTFGPAPQAPTLPEDPMSAKPSWLGRHKATPASKERRELVARLGRRQAIRAIRKLSHLAHLR
jgi:hypothetical protein